MTSTMLFTRAMAADPNADAEVLRGRICFLERMISGHGEDIADKKKVIAQLEKVIRELEEYKAMCGEELEGLVCRLDCK